MAKKEAPVPQPVISSLPLPATDNPLVIDLPDGQKLVVGKMESGTVIEVATWRGTGRPDSRTSRLMLGMSSGDSEPKVNADQTENTASPTHKSKISGINGKFAKYLAKITVFMGFGTEKSTQGSDQYPGDQVSKSSRKQNIKFKFKTPKPTLSFKSKKTDNLSDPDFQNWLDSITKKNSKLANFSTDTKAPKGKINAEAKTGAKAPVKKVAKKAAPKSGRSR
jgi:hypothetical protein